MVLITDSALCMCNFRCRAKSLLMRSYLHTSGTFADDVGVGVVCIWSVYRGGAVW